uniref:THAP-type domain-containing protein n=1 Tax=Cyprinus carpio TaxID=7962 RepID=A0A8C1XED8_CYPCA
MVRKCACRGCPNRQKQPWRRKSALPTPTDERIHFYSFPVNDPDRLKLWLLCVQRDVDLPLQIVRLLTLCSEHFSPDDFISGTGKIRRKLKKNAVPRLCLPHTKVFSRPYPRTGCRVTITGISGRSYIFYQSASSIS